MNDGFRFSPEQWAAVEAIIGDLTGVEVATADDGRFQFVGLADPETIDGCRISPAKIEHVRVHLEGDLFAVRCWIEAKQVTTDIGDSHKRIEKAARALLAELPPLDEDVYPSVLQSKELRSLLHAVVAHSAEMGADVDAMLRRPSHRPKLAPYKVQYWTSLMRLWVNVLKRPPTNSPQGPLARFIDAASQPAKDRLDPSVDRAYEFVKKYRASVWFGEKEEA